MSNDGSRASRARPVLVLGLDGLATRFMEAPFVAECMPNLTSLWARSSAGPLVSTLPAYTGPAWTTITTGVDPGRHGIFGFTDRDGRPVSDARVSAPRLWDYVTEAGGASAVVNVPITHPPRPLEGWLISGMPVPGGSEFTYPETLAGELEAFDYVVDVAVQEGAREGGGTLQRLARMTEARGRAATALARSRSWDLFMVVFVLPDRLGHPWWKHLVPGDDVYATKRAERVRRGARAALVSLDHAIGELLSSLPAGAAVVTCSDHGFGPLRADVFFDVALARAGLIPSDRARGWRRAVSRAGRSRLARLTPPALHGWVRDRIATPGRASPRAAWTTPPYECGVRLADARDDSLRAAVVDLLLKLQDPTGAKVVRAVRRREEVYTGPHVDEAPDLLCEMADESVALHDGLHAPDPWVSRAKLPWGTHAPEGVIAIDGADAPRELRGRAADVAATVLHLLGLKADGLDGSSLIDPQAAEEMTPVAPAGPRRESAAAAEGYSPEQEAAVLEHLKGLGYVD